MHSAKELQILVVNPSVTEASMLMVLYQRYHHLLPI